MTNEDAALATSADPVWQVSLEGTARRRPWQAMRLAMLAHRTSSRRHLAIWADFHFVSQLFLS